MLSVRRKDSLLCPLPISSSRRTAPTRPRAPARALSSQNARTHGFTASSFGVVLNEIANLRTDLIAFYQPVNSQELFAIESVAIAQQEMRRVSRLGAGIFTVCLDMSLNDNGTPFTMSPDLVADIEVTRAFPLFLRYKAQAERLYRRPVEEFERVKALRDELRKEAISDPQPEETEPPSTPAEEPSGTCFSLFVPGAERPNDASSNPEPDVEPDVPEAPSVTAEVPSPSRRSPQPATCRPTERSSERRRANRHRHVASQPHPHTAPLFRSNSQNRRPPHQCYNSPRSGLFKHAHYPQGAPSNSRRSAPK